MNIWLIHIGELLPIDGQVRLSRYGILAEMLAAQGHHVTRWAPTFNHSQKKQRATRDQSIRLSDNHVIELLYAGSYQRNISPQRIRFYRRLARVFAKRLVPEPPPDIILSAVPSPEMCLVSVAYAKQHHVPVVVDVRDLWPDIFLDILPARARPLGRLALAPAFATNREIFRQATAVVGVSENYLAWGLGYAGREQGELDRVFPLAYQDSSPTLGELDLERRRLLDLGLDADKLLCCYFGQFEATYDLETVVAAARILKDDGAADVQFVLCGDGSKMTALSELAAGLDNVILLGWVSPLTISAVMSMADIGLAPYAKGAPQGIPNKPIEYFCGGLLVLSSLRGELDDVITVHNCGMVYEAGDAQGLAQAVQGLRDRPRERQSMKGNARRLFERSFSAERVYGDMIAYLEGLVDVN